MSQLTVLISRNVTMSGRPRNWYLINGLELNVASFWGPYPPSKVEYTPEQAYAWLKIINEDGPDYYHLTPNNKYLVRSLILL